MPPDAPGELAALRQLLAHVLPTTAQLRDFSARHFPERLDEELAAPAHSLPAEFAQLPLLIDRLLQRATVAEIRYRLTLEQPAAVAQHTHYSLQAAVTNAAPRPLRSLPLPRDPHFTGRAEQLGALRGLLLRHHVAVLTGPKGAGKTALALELAYRMAAEHAVVCFVDGTSPKSLCDGFCALAHALSEHGFAIRKTPAGECAAGMRDFFSRHADWLVVVDDLSSASTLEPFLGPGRPAGRLLCTAGGQGGRGPAVLELGPLATAESLELLARRSDRHKLTPAERSAVQRLALELGDQPAALCRAADEVRRCGISWIEALARYRAASALSEAAPSDGR